MLGKPASILLGVALPLNSEVVERTRASVIYTDQTQAFDMLQLSLYGVTHQPCPSTALTLEEIERADNGWRQGERSSSQDSPVSTQPKPSRQVGSSKSEKAHKLGLI